METSIRFDLDHAVAAWRQALQIQPGLSAADVRELEQHLQQSLAELQQHGLGAEESFVLAQRRLGRPVDVADEFAKANPARYWRRCLFWAAGGALFANLWQTSLNYGLWKTSAVLDQYAPALPTPLAIPLGVLLYVAVFGFPLFLAAWFFLRRRARTATAGSGRFFRSRWQLAIAGVLAIAAAEGLQWWVVHTYLQQQSGDGYGALLTVGYNIALFDGFIMNALWPVCLLALMVWLLPRRESSARAVAI